MWRWVDEFTLVTPFKNKDSPWWYKDKRVTWDSLIMFKGKWEYKKITLIEIRKKYMLIKKVIESMISKKNRIEEKNTCIQL